MLHLTKPIAMDTGEKLTITTLFKFYNTTQLPLWFSFFVHDCLDCQNNKHFPNKPNKVSPISPFYENATYFDYQISMDTKGPNSPTSK